MGFAQSADTGIDAFVSSTHPTGLARRYTNSSPEW
jgi:hypothetical protein